MQGTEEGLLKLPRRPYNVPLKFRHESAEGEESEEAQHDPFS